MKKRFLCLLLAGALLPGLTSCAPPAADTPNPSPSPEAEASLTPTPSQEPASTPEPFAVREADVPPGAYAPWQEGYADFLRRKRQGEGEIKRQIDAIADGETGDEELWYVYDDASEEYSLYDVDKDGVPELFVKYGNCEADYYTVCYTFRNGVVTEAGDFGSGHSSLYTWPGENAVIFLQGHMGIGFMQKLSLLDGQLVFTEDFYQDLQWDEESLSDTDPASLVPGAEYIPVHLTPTHWRPADSPALLLPVYDYGALPRQNPAPVEEAQVRSAIGKVLWEGGKLYGVSGDGFHGDTGLVTLEEYLRPGAAYPYHDEALTATQYAWADINGDGQTDCILRLEEKPDEYGNVPSFAVILSLEEDSVYAYFVRHPGEPSVTANGTVYFGGEYQVSFYKNQCYKFPAPAPAVSDGLAWEPFPAKP